MKELTERQGQVLEIIEEEFNKTGNLPSLRKIADRLKVSSKNGVQRHVQALEKKGFLRRTPPKPSPFRLAGDPLPDIRPRIPLTAVIPAGPPQNVFDHPNDYLEFTPEYFGRGNLTAVQVSGESMLGDAIADGDIALISPQKTAAKDDIVAVRVGTDEVTLKRIHQTGDTVELLPSNPAYQVRKVPAEQVEIIGKLVGIIRKI